MSEVEDDRPYGHGGQGRGPRLESPALLGGPWPYVVLAVALLVLGLSFWRPVPAGVWHDDGVYMVIAKSVAQGEGLHYAGVPGDVPAVKFPPAYPLVLSGLWTVLGSVGPVMLTAVLLNLVLLAAAGAALAFSLRSAAGLGGAEALALGGLALVSADVWRLALVPLSEPLFIALTAAALAAWAWAARPGDRRGLALLSTALAAAVLTRSAGLALVAGFGVALALRRSVRAALLVSSPPVLAAVAWALWAAARTPEVPEPLRDLLGPYGPWLAAQILDSPAAFAQALPGHALQVAERALTLLLPGVGGVALWAAGLPLALLIAAGLVLLHRRLPPVTWVTLAYLAMLLLWPFVDRRLVGPLHPLLVIAAGTAVLELTAPSARREMRAAVVTLAFLWVGLLTIQAAWRASSGWAASPYRLRAGRLAAAVETLRRSAPPEAIVGAPEFWAALHLHGGWRTVPSARFTPRAEEEDVPVWGTAQEQIEIWWTTGVDHLLLEQGGQVHGDALNLVEERCPGAVGILARMPPQMLVRLEWDAECAEALGLEAAAR